MAWTTEELLALATADELRIAGRRGDGSLRELVTIWAVVVDDEVHVRSVRGPDGRWYRGVQERHEGRIESGGVEKEVVFTDVAAEDPVQHRVDSAYAKKYEYSPGSVRAISTAEARSTGLKVDPA